MKTSFNSKDTREDSSRFLTPGENIKQYQQAIRETGYVIRNNMYKLQSMSGKQIPIEDISDGYPRQIELMKGIPYYCKIRLRDMRPPLVIKAKYNHGFFQSSLTFYGSYKVKYPTAQKNDLKKVGTPKIFKIMAAEGAELNSFSVLGDSSEWYYFQIETEKANKFQLSCNFPLKPDEKEIARKKLQLKLEYE